MVHFIADRKMVLEALKHLKTAFTVDKANSIFNQCELTTASVNLMIHIRPHPTESESTGYKRTGIRFLIFEMV